MTKFSFPTVTFLPCFHFHIYIYIYMCKCEIYMFFFGDSNCYMFIVYLEREKYIYSLFLPCYFYLFSTFLVSESLSMFLSACSFINIRFFLLLCDNFSLYYFPMFFFLTVLFCFLSCLLSAASLILCGSSARSCLNWVLF